MMLRAFQIVFALGFVFWANAVLAEKSAWRSPDEVAGTQLIDVLEAKDMHDDGALFIDVRNPRQYAKRHIPGALHMDLKSGFTEENLAKVANKDQIVVIYCNGPKCSRSYRASTKAVAWGYSKIQYFRGGIADWRANDFPVESGSP